MGQVFGILAKRESKIITETPIYADEESFYSLANIFMDTRSYVSRILQKIDIDEARKNWLRLDEDEETSLVYNNIEDFAEDEIEYRNSVNEPLPEKFRAIKMRYEPKREVMIYSKEYVDLENWSNSKTILQALYKIKELLYEDLKISIQKDRQVEYLKYTFDNIQLLYSIVRVLKIREKVDEIALVYGPY